MPIEQVDFYGRTYFVTPEGKRQLDALESVGRATDEAVRAILISERQRLSR